MAWVLSPTDPYETCTPARSSCRAQTMLFCSSKRAFSSMATATCFPFSAAAISDFTISEFDPVRYSVILIARTDGSSAARRR